MDCTRKGIVNRKRKTDEENTYSCAGRPHDIGRICRLHHCDAKDTGGEITVVSRENGSGTRGAFIELFGIELKESDGTKKDMTTKEAIIANKTDVMLTNYDNIAFGPRTHGIKARRELDEIVEKALRDAAIWDEAKDRLKKSALPLSGGQQQRLCIARALAVEPEVLLMDEPTSALDPISTSKIEERITDLKKTYTVVIVTHNMQQATRISDKTAFFLLGELVEYGETEQVFSMPRDQRCEDYITGRFG